MAPALQTGGRVSDYFTACDSLTAANTIYAAMRVMQGKTAAIKEGCWSGLQEDSVAGSHELAEKRANDS